jgi:hypothetical protein
MLHASSRHSIHRERYMKLSVIVSMWGYVIEVSHQNEKWCRRLMGLGWIRMMVQSEECLHSLHCQGEQKNRAQHTVVAAEYIRRATRYTDVFTMVECWLNLTPMCTLAWIQSHANACIQKLLTSNWRTQQLPIPLQPGCGQDALMGMAASIKIIHTLSGIVSVYSV